MRARRLWFGLLGTLALTVLPDFAAAQPVGSEFQVNTYTTGMQETGTFSAAGRVVASDASGNFVVVWESNNQDGSSDGIFGQRFDGSGDRLGGEFRVNSTTLNAQRRPSVAAAAGGAFVVVWESPDGDDYGIFGRRFDGAGDAQGPEFKVNSATTNAQEKPSVAIGANGGFVVVWDSDQGGGFGDIFGRRYDAAGNALGTEFRVNSFTPGFQYRPSVASDASGDFVVAWGSSPGGYGAPSYVFGQRYASDGTAQGDEFTVSDKGSPPSVASDAVGNFVVVWHVWGAYGGNEIYGRRFDSAGAPLGPTFHVNTYDYNYQQRPSVASDASGNFVVAWASRHQDGDLDGIFGQRYDSGGVAQGEEFQISTYTTGPQYSTAVAATGTDQFVVVWTSEPQDGSAEGVFGQRFDFAGGGTITVVSPNTNVKWRIGSLQKIRWTHNLGQDATFRIELDRDDDGNYEERIAVEAPVDHPSRGSLAWTVTGPVSTAARVRVSWTANPSVSDTSDVPFQIRPAPLSATESLLER